MRELNVHKFFAVSKTKFTYFNQTAQYRLVRFTGILSLKKNLAGSKCPVLALRFIAASSEGRLFYCLSLVVVVSFFSGSWEQSFDSVLDDESELRVRGEG